MDELIRVYFSDENWSFPVLDEHRFLQVYGDFRRQSDGLLRPTTSPCLSSTLLAVPALLFSVLAVVLQFVPQESDALHALGVSSPDQCDRLSRHYRGSGQEMIDLLRQRKPSTTSIEYHLSTCTWFKNNGTSGEAWQSLGTAIRQAQEIDLHQIREDEVQGHSPKVEESPVRLWELEHQKHLWARLFIMDAHMAMALGRPRTIDREDCSTPPPLDCDYPSRPAQTVPQSTQHAYQPPSTSSFILYWLALSHKIHDMLSVRASKAYLRDDTIIQSIHREMITLVDELPSALRPLYPDTTWDQQMPQLPSLRQRILTTANIFLLALHRPYISTHPVSRRAAIEAAFGILQTQQRLFEIVLAPQRKLYGYSFYTLDAGTFLTGVRLKYPNFGVVTSVSALQEMRLAATRLSLMKGRNPMAEKGEPILQQCCHVIAARTCSPLSAYSDQDIRGAVFSDNIATLLELDSSAPDEPIRGLLGTLADPAVLASSGIDPFDQASGTLVQNGGIASFLDGGEIW